MLAIETTMNPARFFCSVWCVWCVLLFAHPSQATRFKDSKPLPHSEKQSIESLIHWITTNSYPRDHQSLLLPTIAINDKLHVRISDTMGHGVFTKETLVPGEVLASIPMHSVITLTAGIKRHPNLINLFHAIKLGYPRLGDLACFALLLLLESRQCSAGTVLPRWLPYLNIMKPDQSHPLKWSMSKLAETVHESERNIVLEMQKEILMLYQTLMENKELNKHCPALFVGPQRVSNGELKWVVIHLLSNLFGIRRKTKANNQSSVPLHLRSFHTSSVAYSHSNKDTTRLQLSLIPFVHFFNHKDHALVHYQYDSTRNCIHFWAAQRYAAGEQVYLNYGHNVSASILLLNYGILVDSYSGGGSDADGLREGNVGGGSGSGSGSGRGGEAQEVLQVQVAAGGGTGNTDSGEM